eukprot:6204270-Pleurochrysis_carterae.AAC.1
MGRCARNHAPLLAPACPHARMRDAAAIPMHTERQFYFSRAERMQGMVVARTCGPELLVSLRLRTHVVCEPPMIARMHTHACTNTHKHAYSARSVARTRSSARSYDQTIVRMDTGLDSKVDASAKAAPLTQRVQY